MREKEKVHFQKAYQIHITLFTVNAYLHGRGFLSFMLLLKATNAVMTLRSNESFQ